jgi:magnesium-transporting ATPase (P-type)
MGKFEDAAGNKPGSKPGSNREAMEARELVPGDIIRVRLGDIVPADSQGQWRFLGVLPLFDPQREDSKSTIANARQMGVNVKMVTGDQLAIARETAGQLGLGTNILDAGGFGDTKHHETPQLAESIEKADGFAQVFPEHKFHIADVLQHRNHIVGMTGGRSPLWRKHSSSVHKRFLQ